MKTLPPIVKEVNEVKKRKSPKVMLRKLIETSNKLKNFASSVPEKSSYLFTKVKEYDISLKYIDRDIKNLIMSMDKSSNRVTFGLIITALIIASTMMLEYDQIKIMEISAFSFIGFALSGLLILIIVISILREKKY